jgi:hypothetical protein
MTFWRSCAMSLGPLGSHLFWWDIATVWCSIWIWFIVHWSDQKLYTRSLLFDLKLYTSGERVWSLEERSQQQVASSVSWDEPSCRYILHVNSEMCWVPTCSLCPLSPKINSDSCWMLNTELPTLEPPHAWEMGKPQAPKHSRVLLRAAGQTSK